ncbi:hypothetical protein [Paenibacillus xylanilyticus]|uniref:Uncharacterized protein n=1 Tax=Paenibacillus xylanilyticus TaxID=248903 RepID=A0A7Y6EUI8_9BACL|nr:hypothetical protein [Paenibacillus xylanilyticus]NUU74739.1 hypothetical protein [Paenibacillus xylanilyticus]
MSDFEPVLFWQKHELGGITAEWHGNVSVKNGRRQMFLFPLNPARKKRNVGRYFTKKATNPFQWAEPTVIPKKFK